MTGWLPLGSHPARAVAQSSRPLCPPRPARHRGDLVPGHLPALLPCLHDEERLDVQVRPVRRVVTQDNDRAGLRDLGEGITRLSPNEATRAQIAEHRGSGRCPPGPLCLRHGVSHPRGESLPGRGPRPGVHVPEPVARRLLGGGGVSFLHSAELCEGRASGRCRHSRKKKQNQPETHHRWSIVLGGTYGNCLPSSNGHAPVRAVAVLDPPTTASLLSVLTPHSIQAIRRMAGTTRPFGLLGMSVIT